MIQLHRLNGQELYLNNRQIETMEETPDTVIMLTNDRKYIVKESVDEIIDKIIKYERKIVNKSK